MQTLDREQMKRRPFDRQFDRRAMRYPKGCLRPRFGLGLRLLESKKGYLGVMLIFVVLIASAVFFITAIKTGTDPEQRTIGELQMAMLETSARAENVLLYIDDSANIALERAADELSLAGGFGINPDCGAIGGFSIWDFDKGTSGCIPSDEEISENLKQRFDANLNSLLTSYPLQPLPLDNYDYYITDRLTLKGIAKEDIIFTAMPYVLGEERCVDVTECVNCDGVADKAKFFEEKYGKDGLNFPYVWGGESPYTYEETIRDQQSNPDSVFRGVSVTQVQPGGSKRSGKPTVPGFDCSGFVWWVYKHAGLVENRLTAQGYLDMARTDERWELVCDRSKGSPCDESAVKKAPAGSLVFGYPNADGIAGHIMIYIGEMEIIHSSGSGDGIIREKVKDRHISQFIAMYAPKEDGAGVKIVSSCKKSTVGQTTGGPTGTGSHVCTGEGLPADYLQKLHGYADKYSGKVGYKTGGGNPDAGSVDCSGFIYWMLIQQGIVDSSWTGPVFASGRSPDSLYEYAKHHDWTFICDSKSECLQKINTGSVPPGAIAFSHDRETEGCSICKFGHVYVFMEDGMTLESSGSHGVRYGKIFSTYPSETKAIAMPAKGVSCMSAGQSSDGVSDASTGQASGSSSGTTSGSTSAASSGSSSADTLPASGTDQASRSYDCGKKTAKSTPEHIYYCYGAFIDKYSQMMGVDRCQVIAQMIVESQGMPEAKSGAGARGLIQLMPGTESDMRAAVAETYEIDAKDAFDPESNIAMATEYIRRMLVFVGFNKDNPDENKLHLALAAYNWGPGNLQKACCPAGRCTSDFDSCVVPQETKRYRDQVMSYYAQCKGASLVPGTTTTTGSSGSSDASAYHGAFDPPQFGDMIEYAVRPSFRADTDFDLDWFSKARADAFRFYTSARSCDSRECVLELQEQLGLTNWKILPAAQEDCTGKPSEEKLNEADHVFRICINTSGYVKDGSVKSLPDAMVSAAAKAADSALDSSSLGKRPSLRSQKDHFIRFALRVRYDKENGDGQNSQESGGEDSVSKSFEKNQDLLNFLTEHGGGTREGAVELADRLGLMIHGMTGDFFISYLEEYPDMEFSVLEMDAIPFKTIDDYYGVNYNGLDSAGQAGSSGAMYPGGFSQAVSSSDIRNLVNSIVPGQCNYCAKFVRLYVQGRGENTARSGVYSHAWEMIGHMRNTGARTIFEEDYKQAGANRVPYTNPRAIEALRAAPAGSIVLITNIRSNYLRASRYGDHVTHVVVKDISSDGQAYVLQQNGCPNMMQTQEEFISTYAAPGRFIIKYIVVPAYS